MVSGHVGQPAQALTQSIASAVAQSRGSHQRALTVPAVIAFIDAQCPEAFSALLRSVQASTQPIIQECCGLMLLPQSPRVSAWLSAESRSSWEESWPIPTLA